jgi:hypothetical protein
VKTVLAVVVTIVAMVVVAHAALTFRGPRHWAGMEHPMMMQIGPHMMGQGAGPTGPGMHRGAMPATQVGEDEAKAIAVEVRRRAAQGVHDRERDPEHRDAERCTPSS